jgi:transcriptional regulator with XRE-family HTH domain
MKPSKIKALLMEKEIRHKDIAEALGVSNALISGVLGGYFESRRVKQAIADALQMKYEKVWGKAA